MSGSGPGMNGAYPTVWIQPPESKRLKINKLKIKNKIETVSKYWNQT